MKQIKKTVPLVPLRCTEIDRSVIQPNPLKPDVRSLKTVATGGDSPNPIVLCVTCRSRDISQETHFFWLWKRWRFVCNECGTTLQQVGEKYMLTRVPDTGSTVWRKYAGKILRRREWANIANGGLSDEEIAISWTGRIFAT